MNPSNYIDLLQRSANTATQIAAEYDNLWNNALGLGDSGPNLYGALCQLGTVFAVATLVVLILKMYTEVQQGNTASMVQIILPLIVGLLLLNNGRQLATFTLEIRELINNLNNQVLLTTINNQDLNQSFYQANMVMALQEEMGKFFRPCTSLIGSEGKNCLKEAYQQSTDFLTVMHNAFPSGFTPIINQYQAVLSLIDGSIDENPNVLFPGFAVSSSISDFFSPFMAPIWQNILFSILVAMSRGYQHALELALLLTALLGPLAVGGSLLPTGAALPGFAWLTGFFSLAIAKLSFNIILGLISVIINSQATTLDNLWFPTILGLFAPILASGLAAGGGLAIWQAIISGAEKGASALRLVFESIPF